MADEMIELFRLPQYLNEIVRPSERSNAEKRKSLAENPFIQQERMLASHVRNAYIRERQLEARVKVVTQRLRQVEAKVANATNVGVKPK